MCLYEPPFTVVYRRLPSFTVVHRSTYRREPPETVIDRHLPWFSLASTNAFVYDVFFLQTEFVLSICIVLGGKRYLGVHTRWRHNYTTKDIVPYRLLSGPHRPTPPPPFILIKYMPLFLCDPCLPCSLPHASLPILFHRGPPITHEHTTQASMILALCPCFFGW